MSDFRFGVDDYSLNYHPHDVSDGWGGIDWDKVECVEIDWVKFVRERTCHAESDLSEWVCSRCQCWIPLGLTPENIKHASEWRYCPHCGAKVER